MAANQLIGPLPAITLDAGCSITVEAIDPSSGATVSGVVVSQVAIYGVNVTPAEALAEPPPILTYRGD
jgi:hypothetical protein